MIDRTIEKSIKEKLFKGKVIILIGPRQVGKTTLLRKILEKEDYLFLDGDESIVMASLENVSAKYCLQSSAIKRLSLLMKHNA